MTSTLLQDDLLWNRRVSGSQYLEARRILNSAPSALQAALEARYASLAGPTREFWSSTDGRVLDSWNEAMKDLRTTGRSLQACRTRIAHDDDALENAADQSARICVELGTYAHAAAYAVDQHVRLPVIDGRITERSVLKRLRSPDWWRRQLRTHLTRGCEELFRVFGFVRAQTCAYVSADGFERCRAAGFKGRCWLAEMAAVCEDTGETLQLLQIAEHSLANPALRRGELMLRARGFQEVAEASGHRCLMVTLTCPSAYHAWLRESGAPNPRFAGATPRDGQRWLTEHWARARARLQDVLYYGFRVAEPHHDATPHWHLVIYAHAQDLETIQSVLTDVWLKTYADEPGATQHRVKFTEEDAAKGSGVGYLAKYIAKNIDAAGAIGSANSDESGDPVHAQALRAVAWARLHGIRQFQQLGGPAVTLWRHLRRVREPCEWEPLEALRVTTDHTDQSGPSWSRFIGALGGIERCLPASRAYWDKQEPRCVDPAGRRVLRLTRWGELPVPMIIGLQVVWRDRIRRLPTRVHVWFLVFCPVPGSGLFCTLGPVAITVAGAPSNGAPAAWTNPQETSQGPPRRNRR